MDQQEQQTPQDVFAAWCDEEDKRQEAWWKREAERVRIEQMHGEGFLAMVGAA